MTTVSPSSIDLSALPSIPLSERSRFPEVPCVYFAIDAQGVVQYIGKTRCLRNRWAQHHRYNQLKSRGDVSVAYLSIDDTALLQEIENALIEWFSPPLNRSAVTGNDRIRVVACLPESLKKKGERLADIQQRSLSSLLAHLLSEAVKNAEANGEKLL